MRLDEAFIIVAGGVGSSDRLISTDPDKEP
jgi:hypothetical protein